MSERILAGLITFVLVLIIAFLTYFNEHMLVRSFNDYFHDKVKLLTSNLKREVESCLVNGERERVAQILSNYGRSRDVKLIAVFDSAGRVLFHIGDTSGVRFEGLSGQMDLARYVPEREVYEAISSIESEGGMIGWVALMFKVAPHMEVMRRVNLLVFSVIALAIIIGFIGIVAVYNRKIVAPISRVSEVVKDLARGVYNIRLEAQPSSAIYEFAENFNQMVRLIDEKEKRLEKQKSHFKLISEISRLGLEISSVDEFFKKVVHLIRDEFNFLSVIYFSLDASRSLRLTAVAGYLENNLGADYTVGVGYGIPGSCVLLGDVVVVNDVSRSPQFIPLHPNIPVASEMSVPIKKRGKVIGVLDISSDKTDAFTSEDVRIFRTVAETITLVLEKFDSVMRNIRLLFKLETVYRLTRGLVLVRDVDKIFEDAVKLIYSVLEKKELVVEIYERLDDTLVLRSIFGSLNEPFPERYSQSINEGVLGRAVRERNYVYIPELVLEPGAKRFYKTTSSEVAIPLIVKDEVIGVINCESEVVNAFDDVDILVLRTIADMLSIAIHNAQMYSRIQESESRYRAIFENSNEAIFRIDLDGKLIDVNPAFVKIFGFDLEDNVNFYSLFISGESVEKFKGELLSRGYVAGFDARLRNKKGDVLSVKISLNKFVRAKDKVYYDGVIVDLTELEKIHEARRLRGLVQIAGGMAHEFNNIFASILGSAQLIKMRSSPGEKIYYWADIIERSTVKGAGLVRKLIWYAGAGKFRVSSVNLNEMVIELLKKIDTGEKIVVKTEFDPGIPEIVCDREQIFQVLFDIVQNAIEAMENGGILSIQTGSGYYDKSMVDDPEFVPGEYVRITISDTGTGMPEEVMKRIFEPFFTTKRAMGKSGLGLSMAYGVIKNHDGFITVSSTPGQGSKFSIFLPVSKVEKEQNRS